MRSPSYIVKSKALVFVGSSGSCDAIVQFADRIWRRPGQQIIIAFKPVFVKLACGCRPEQ